MNELLTKINTIYQRKSVKYAIPFLLVVLGGSFGLKEFTKLRYEFSKVTKINPNELEKQGIVMKKPGEVTLESEYEKIKDLDVDNWKQIRGPRPWEENTSFVDVFQWHRYSGLGFLLIFYATAFFEIEVFLNYKSN